jgi:hypothetical protein
MSEDCEMPEDDESSGVYDAPAGFTRWELDEITDPDERVKWMKKGWDPKRHLGTQIGIVGMRHPGSIDGVDMSDPDIAACVKVISNDDLMTTEEFDRLLEENDAELDRVCKRRDRMTNEERALLALYYVAADIQDRGILQLNYHSALAAELRKVLEQCRPFVADML